MNGREDLRAVIFDLDGVLIDSEPIHSRAWREVLANYGIKPSPEWLRRWVGVPDADLGDYLAREKLVPTSAAEILEFKRARYVELTAKFLRPFPGVVEGLARLRARGLAVAIATSAHANEARHALRCAGLNGDGAIAVAVTLDDVARPKPAPDPYQLAMARLGLTAAVCLAVEDSTTGIASARAAGLDVIAVASTHRPEELSRADHWFATTAAAINWILFQDHRSER